MTVSTVVLVSIVLAFIVLSTGCAVNPAGTSTLMPLNSDGVQTRPEAPEYVVAPHTDAAGTAVSKNADGSFVIK